MPTTKTRADAWARRRLPVLIAAAAIAASGAAAGPAAGALAATGGHTASQGTPQTASITFQAANLGDHDQLVITFPGAAPALSHSDLWTRPAGLSPGRCGP